MRNRFYIIFVSREEDGRLRKIPVPLHYAYIFVAAAVVGAFSIAGMAGSYSRMLMKTANFNQIRSEREAIRRNYLHMEQTAHEKDIQAASLGTLASEVTALYGLRQNKLTAKSAAKESSVASTPVSDDFNQQQYDRSIDQFYALRSSAMSGQVSRALEGGLNLTNTTTDWIQLADAPSLWPVQGRVTSSFGQREDPFNGEGAFHAGIDISSSFGQSVRAAADGVVEAASMANGYGREVVIDHGHGVRTVYAHLSGFTVMSGQQIKRGQVIGYVGLSGRSTGPHLHYEVRLHNTPVNPHKYLRTTMEQLAVGHSDTLSGGVN
ncbi:MAG TPA: M23 family metallopeptidase [Acidisarcina sp.]|nr:M23 family metallopeptidase [Acidisarcina sp.]